MVDFLLKLALIHLANLIVFVVTIILKLWSISNSRISCDYDTGKESIKLVFFIAWRLKVRRIVWDFGVLFYYDCSPICYFFNAFVEIVFQILLWDKYTSNICISDKQIWNSWLICVHSYVPEFECKPNVVKKNWLWSVIFSIFIYEPGYKLRPRLTHNQNLHIWGMFPHCLN